MKEKPKTENNNVLFLLLKRTLLWYIEWERKALLGHILYFPSSYILAWWLAVHPFSCTKPAMLRTTKQSNKSLPLQALQALNLYFTGFWHLNKSLKSHSVWDELYLWCAVPPITYWAKSEISVGQWLFSGLAGQYNKKRAAWHR